MVGCGKDLAAAGETVRSSVRRGGCAASTAQRRNSRAAGTPPEGSTAALRRNGRRRAAAVAAGPERISATGRHAASHAAVLSPPLPPQACSAPQPCRVRHAAGRLQHQMLFKTHLLPAHHSLSIGNKSREVASEVSRSSIPSQHGGAAKAAASLSLRRAGWAPARFKDWRALTARGLRSSRCS